MRDAGKLRELIVAENYSHLDLPETLCNPYGVLGAPVLKMMGLGKGSRFSLSLASQAGIYQVFGRFCPWR